jgi:hypothetical protein
MTQDQKTLFEVTLEKVRNSTSSIFAKEDVIGLLTTLNDSISELPEVAPEPAVGYDTDTILKAVKDMLNNYNFDQYIDVEPELNGGIMDHYTLEINARFDETQFTRDFLCELPDYFETIKEEE